MAGLLDALPVGSIGAGALVSLIVLMVLTGRLVSRQQILDVREDRDKWRQAAEDWQRTAHTHGMTMEKLLVLAQTTNHALTEIQTLAQRAADSGGPR